MVADIKTVMWKEWRGLFRQRGGRSRTVLTLVSPLGLAIYLPDNWGVLDPDYNAGELDFAADTQWDEFLAWWTGVADSSWTFMVYMSGDNNLEGYALEDFLEMASVGSDDAVNIVVMLDRSTFYDTSFNDWTGAHRGLINFGDLPYDADDPGFPPAYFAWGTDLGEVNMGDPDVLSDFVNWATTMYPAENYALTFWDHGGGLDGVIYDDDDGGIGFGDNLTVMEVDEALQAVGVNIDVLRFDACLMAMVEVAYQVRNDADYMVASEDLGWAVGSLGILSPYDTVLRTLTMQPSMTPLELADFMAESYYTSWPAGSRPSWSKCSKPPTSSTTPPSKVWSSSTRSAAEPAPLTASRWPGPSRSTWPHAPAAARCSPRTTTS